MSSILQYVKPSDRWKIEYIKAIVEEEFDRCISFGISPGVEDYAIAIEQWLTMGVSPSVAQAEAEIEQSAKEARREWEKKNILT